MKNSLPLTPAERFAILRRDGFACRYCGARAPEVRLHVDHVKARSRGGTNAPSNLVTACQDCNLGKSDHDLGSRYWCQREYAVAGMAIGEALERFGDAVPSDDVFALIDLAFSGPDAAPVIDIIRGSSSWPIARQAAWAFMHFDDEEVA